MDSKYFRSIDNTELLLELRNRILSTIYNSDNVETSQFYQLSSHQI